VLDESEVEQRLVDAFDDVRATVVEHPDLFSRVQRALVEAKERRLFRLRLGAAILGGVAAVAALTLSLSDFQEGRLLMPWWVLELVTNIVLISLAIALGPFIKRFGRAYAADVFGANPRTGKSYLVLTDVAYYLVFAAYILLSMRFVEAANWVDHRLVQLQHEVARVGGMLLLLGGLHTANVLALPVIGNLLNAVRRSDRPAPKTDPGASDGPSGTVSGALSTPPLAPGTWLLRIEPVGDDPLDTPAKEE
jgi:hypothetical protein